jgi:hypothetical protein
LLKWLALLLGIGTLSFNVIGNNQFNCALGASVRVGWTYWAVLGNGNHVGKSSRITVHSRGGGEDDIGNIVFGHAPEESDGSANIDTVVFERNLGGFADCLGCTSQHLFI